MGTHFVWSGFFYIPHFLFVSVTCMARKKEEHKCVCCSVWILSSCQNVFYHCASMWSFQELWTTSSCHSLTRWQNGPVQLVSHDHFPRSLSKNPSPLGQQPSTVSLTAHNQRTRIKRQIDLDPVVSKDRLCTCLCVIPQRNLHQVDSVLVFIFNDSFIETLVPYFHRWCFSARQHQPS